MNGAGRTYFKVVTIGLTLLLAVAVVWHWGRPAYRQAKQNRQLTEAQASFERGDYRGALMNARLVLMLDSNNVPACRIMASLAEVSRSPAAMDWRQRIAEREPTVANKLALAATALQFENPPFPLTTQVLDQLAPTATNLAAYQSAAMMLALRLNRPADAERHMAAAAELEPTNRAFSLNLAVLRLDSTNPATAIAARETLIKLSHDANLGPAALRSLMTDRLRHDDLPAARDYATQLLATASVTLGDRLQYLGILKNLHSPDLAAQLKTVQHVTATNALLAAQTAAWMQGNGFVAETATWLNALPASIQTQPAVQLALVDYYIGTTNWQGLLQLTAKGDWGELNFLRLAFLSRAWSEQGEPVVADANWRSAVNQAGDRVGALNELLNLARRWGRINAQADLLDRILRRYPDATWAQQALEQLYLNTGDTRKLYQLYARLLARAPQNVTLKNNLTAAALLLKTNLTQAGQWAAELYAQQPADPVIVSTYAFARHLQGSDAQGLAALQKLTPAQLEQPAIALYYGVLLTATGDRGQGDYFLTRAESAGHLLPEEKALVAEARQKTN
jgi:predicted Zn-dependent protease